MSYLLGNLLGRAIVSYLLMLLVWTLLCRFDFKKAFKRSLRWTSWVAVVLLSLLGLAVHVGG
jgi:hypothetical protein